MNFVKRLLLGIAVISCCTGSRSVLAETTICTEITSIPTVITQQGVYCLHGNLSSSSPSGRMIDIQKNNVTIDLNGWKIGGLGAGTSSSATGIYANGRRNITIRNGIIRGFNVGIQLNDAPPYSNGGHLIEDVRLDRNYKMGMDIRGAGSNILNNIVLEIHWRNNQVGIQATGEALTIAGNKVHSVRSEDSDSATGIHLFNATYSLVKDNHIGFVDLPARSFGDVDRMVGIKLESSFSTIVRDNSITMEIGEPIVDDEHSVVGRLTSSDEMGNLFNN